MELEMDLDRQQLAHRNMASARMYEILHERDRAIIDLQVLLKEANDKLSLIARGHKVLDDITKQGR